MSCFFVSIKKVVYPSWDNLLRCLLLLLQFLV
jgi:hypothetical protein